MELNEHILKDIDVFSEKIIPEYLEILQEILTRGWP